MSKITNKFLKVFLTLSLLTTVSFTTFAQTKQAKNEKVVYSVIFYKEKELEKNNKTTEKNLGKINNFENITNARELVNLQAVIQKLFEKYKLPRYKTIGTAKTSDKEQIKFIGIASIITNDSKKDALKKLLKNFNKEIKNIKITRKDFENAKDEVLKNQKNEDEAIEKQMKVFEGKDLIETEKILVKNLLRIQKKSLENITKSKNKKNLKNVKDTIKYYENILKSDELLKKNGEWTYITIENFKKSILPNMKKQIEQIKNVKYEDIKDLTKDLKININSLIKQKYCGVFKLKV